MFCHVFLQYNVTRPWRKPQLKASVATSNAFRSDRSSRLPSLSSTASALTKPSARRCIALPLRASIRRIAKGYYDIPRTNPRIGPLSPTPEAIIAAHARKTGAIIERPEVDAANKLGLTTQVPAQPVYRTNLFPRELNIGGQRIRLRTAGPRSLARDADPAELVIDALQTMGRRHITPKEITVLRKFVREHDLARKLKRRGSRVPTWMVPYIDEILTDS